MRLPIRQAQHLWHWGELDLQKKQAAGISFEGRLFSMSAYPNAWRVICKYGDMPLHRSDEPVHLLDSNAIFHSMAYSAKRLRGAIQQWGIDNGLLEHAFIYRVTEEDDELGRELQTFYRTAAEAEAHAEDPEQIDWLDLVVCTAALNAINGFPAPDIVDESYILIEWAKQFPQIHGIYWNDTLHPGSMAPRSGLYQVPKLTAVDPANLPEDRKLKESVSKVKWIDIENNLTEAFAANINSSERELT